MCASADWERQKDNDDGDGQKGDEENELIKRISKWNCCVCSIWIHGGCAINAFIIHYLVAYLPPKNEEAARLVGVYIVYHSRSWTMMLRWKNAVYSIFMWLHILNGLTDTKSVINERDEHITRAILLLHILPTRDDDEF